MEITKENAASYRHAAEGLKATYERKAGKKARENREAVNRELTEATDVFAVSDWANLTNEEIAKVGGRIKRLATNLAALEKVRYYESVIRKCETVLAASS